MHYRSPPKYLFWPRMRAEIVANKVPTKPLSAHHRFCRISPAKMISPLRGLFTNITWAAPLNTQSRIWRRINCPEQGNHVREHGRYKENLHRGLNTKPYLHYVIMLLLLICISVCVCFVVNKGHKKITLYVNRLHIFILVRAYCFSVGCGSLVIQLQETKYQYVD